MARQTTYELLPAIWRRLDTDTVLERFLNVWEYEYGIIVSKIQELLTIQNPDKTQDRYLRLLGTVVGHEWDTDESYSWNRKRIKDSIHRHSYKGTVDRIADDMAEIGAESVQITDNASKLLVLSKQGRLSEPDSYMVTADFWHDGAYVMQLTDTTVPRLEFNKVDSVLSKTLPAGTIWYLIYGKQLFALYDIDFSLLHGQALFTGDQRSGVLGYGQLIDDYQEDANIFLSWLPNSKPQKSYYPIVWHWKGNILDGTVGYSSLGEDTFLSFCPTINLVKTRYAIDYHQSSLFYSSGLLGEDLSLSYAIDSRCAKTQHLLRSVIFDCGPTEAVDTYTQYLSWVFDFDTTRANTNINQIINDVSGIEDVSPQILTEMQQFAVAQGYLTGDSNLPGNMDEIYGNEGDEAIPLTSYQAALQTGTQKSYEEIPS